MPLQRIKMHLPLVFSTIIFLSHFSLLPYVSSSPMPGRQQGVYQHQGEPKEKCPELTYCDCVERNNKQRKLDITCNGVTSAQLKEDSEKLKIGGDHLIQYFKIRNGNIPKLADHIFMGMKIEHLYIHNCKLEGLGTASISSQGATLSHLVLSKNLLKDVPTRALKLLRNLDHLNLNDNKITALHENAFKGLSKVTRLSLYDNEIHAINKDAFESLTRDLIRLNLGRNRLDTIPYAALRNLNHLQILEMSDNQISTAAMTPNGFKGLRKLDQLVLSSNGLDAINANWFVGLTSLHDLKICDNKISDIDEGAFNGLNESLESLELTKNDIEEFPSKALTQIVELVTLHIDHNRIKYISETAFRNYGENIKYLWMQENEIENITPGTFTDLHSLEWIKLYNNKLTTLKYELMEPVLDSLMHIDIHSNPLVCDCELRWYKQWIESEWNEIEETWLRETTCKDMVDDKIHVISEVDLKDMFCDSDVKDKPGKDGAAAVFHGMDWLFVTLLGALLHVWFPTSPNTC